MVELGLLSFSDLSFQVERRHHNLSDKVESAANSMVAAARAVMGRLLKDNEQHMQSTD